MLYLVHVLYPQIRQNLEAQSRRHCQIRLSLKVSAMTPHDFAWEHLDYIRQIIVIWRSSSIQLRFRFLTYSSFLGYLRTSLCASFMHPSPQKQSENVLRKFCHGQAQGSPQSFGITGSYSVIKAKNYYGNRYSCTAQQQLQYISKVALKNIASAL